MLLLSQQSLLGQKKNTIRQRTPLEKHQTKADAKRQTQLKVCVAAGTGASAVAAASIFVRTLALWQEGLRFHARARHRDCSHKPRLVGMEKERKRKKKVLGVQQTHIHLSWASSRVKQTAVRIAVGRLEVGSNKGIVPFFFPYWERGVGRGVSDSVYA